MRIWIGGALAVGVDGYEIGLEVNKKIFGNEVWMKNEGEGGGENNTGVL